MAGFMRDPESVMLEYWFHLAVFRVRLFFHFPHGLVNASLCLLRLCGLAPIIHAVVYHRDSSWSKQVYKPDLEDWM